jgi:serine/threonine-protein kinase
VIACGRCGHDNDDADLVCARCGTELDDGGARALLGETVLAVYQIDDVLGRGGMSVVYRAHHKMTEQKVALKILPPELAVHASLKTRFLEEAKALARLEHANIVRLYNFGEEAGRFVLAMELVEGETFEKMTMKRGSLGVPWPVVARIGAEVCKALDYAHKRGVVHRDIKPSNVLVRPDGTATVMDFGIAKMTESTRLTATGQTMGTVRYMSPEQVRGQSVDARSDIYSLGVALFEGLTGDTPFQGDTHFEIMSKHLNEAPPSARAQVPDVSEAMDRVILKALAKPLPERYQTAGELQAALEACLKDIPFDKQTLSVAVPPPPALSPPRPVPVATPPRAAMTGLASRLEPAIVDAPVAAAGKGRTRLWLALTAAVLAGSAGVIVAMKKTGTSGAAAAVAPGAAAKPVGTSHPADAAMAAPEWPEPLVPEGLKFDVDQRFEAPEAVRVLSTKKRDAQHLARSYVAARSRFVDFADKRHAGAAVEVHPLNLAVVPQRVLCDPRLYAPPDAPSDKCADLRFYYEPRSRTLFVVDDDSTELVNLPEGAAVHLCRTTPALHARGCGATLLNPYFDEIERDL